jgi:hypothetical protein
MDTKVQEREKRGRIKKIIIAAELSLALPNALPK